MLSEEKPRFSVKDVLIAVSLTFGFATGYALLTLKDGQHDYRLTQIENGLLAGDVPRRLMRLEIIMCATDDKARSVACDQMREQK